MMAVRYALSRKPMPRPIHFGIHAENPQRAIKFYTDLFGWTFGKWNGPQDYWLIKIGESGTPGIDGGLLPPCRGSRPPSMPGVPDSPILINQ